jgi:hypothetical protein
VGLLCWRYSTIVGFQFCSEIFVRYDLNGSKISIKSISIRAFNVIKIQTSHVYRTLNGPVTFDLYSRQKRHEKGECYRNAQL